MWRDDTLSPSWILLYEEAFLQSLCLTLGQNATCINIGAGAGTSTSAMLRAGVTVLSVDIDQQMLDKERETVRAQKLNEAGLYQVCVASAEAAKNVGDNTANLVFVDGIHSYEGVKDDLASYDRKVKPGGLLVCHDYHDPRQQGVTKAIDEWHETHKDWLLVGIVLYMVAYRKPGGNEEWRNGRL